MFHGLVVEYMYRTSASNPNPKANRNPKLLAELLSCISRG